VASTNTSTLVSQGLVSAAQLVASTNTTTLVAQGLVSAAQLVASTNSTTLAAQGMATKAYTDAATNDIATYARAQDTVVSNGITPRIIKSLGISIDGGGSVIASGTKGYLEVPVACTIISARIMADQSGSIAIETWRTNTTVGNFPPTRAGALFTNYLGTASSSLDSTFTGNTGLSLDAQDILGFNVTTNALSCTQVTLQLRVQP
jgi:hypothetical protein